MSVADPVIHAVIEEMADLADSLSRLACVLASDPAVVNNHFDELQSIDLMTQIQRALAALLCQPGSIETRLAQVPVEALAGRLERRITACRDQAA